MNEGKRAMMQPIAYKANIFWVNRNIQKMMSRVDLTDSDTKLFGEFIEASFKTPKKITKKYLEKFIDNDLVDFYIGAIFIDGKIAVKNGIMVLSNERVNIMVRDLKNMVRETERI